MSDVDLFDQFVFGYRVCSRSRKCEWPFFALAVNTSVANAWNLFWTVQKQKIGMLEFQTEVVMTILASFGRNRPEKSRALPRNVASSVKFDTKNHILLKDRSKYCRCKHSSSRLIYYARNAILPYTQTVLGTLIHETQNLLYCFLPEMLIM